MVKRRWIFFQLIAFLAMTCLVDPAIGNGSEESLDSFVGRIQKVSDQVYSFSCSFTQEKRLALFTKPIIFKGELAISRPDRLRWEFIAPVPSVLILRGDEGVRCNDQAPANEFQLSTDPVMKMVAKQLWLWLGGDYKRLNNQYKLEKRNSAVLVITPLEQTASEYISSVSIYFNEQSLQPHKVEISEPGGDLTRIIFDDPVINGDLSEKLFEECSGND